MGLSADAYVQAIRKVGNYDEIWVNNLAPLGLVRAGTAKCPLDGGWSYLRTAGPLEQWLLRFGWFVAKRCGIGCLFGQGGCQPCG